VTKADCFPALAFFIDSRRFFSDAIDRQGRLPMSSLQLLLSTVRAGDISVHSNVPYQLFSGDTEGGNGSTHPASTTAARSGASATTGREYHNVPKKLSDLLGDVRTRYPGVRMTSIFASVKPAISYKEIRLGPTDSCLDFMMLGKCMAPSCSYKHNAALRAASKQVDAVFPKVQKAWKASNTI